MSAPFSSVKHILTTHIHLESSICSLVLL